MHSILRIKYFYHCSKRQLVTFRSSLLVTILSNVQNITANFNHDYIKHKYIYKHQSTDTNVIENDKLITAWVGLKLFIAMCLIK
jgi:hypothetical protein